MRIHHGAWGGSAAQRLGPGDWLFLSAPVVIVGVAITRACPLPIAHFVPRVSMGDARDGVGARLKGGAKCVGFGVPGYGAMSAEWKSGFSRGLARQATARQGPRAIKVNRGAL